MEIIMGKETHSCPGEALKNNNTIIVVSLIEDWTNRMLRGAV